MLDELSRRVFDKFASGKSAKSNFLLDKFARLSNLFLKLVAFGTSSLSGLVQSLIDEVAYFKN
jgi:hypothetical protein